jgi:Fe-S cluster biogenesis protein NfuA
MLDLENQIKGVIDKIRPFIQRDGGDISFDHYADGVVYVKMRGACVGCSAVDSTIGDGVEIILQEEVPEVVRVEVVD